MQQETQSESTALYFKKLWVYNNEELLNFFGKFLTMYNKYIDRKVTALSTQLKNYTINTG